MADETGNGYSADEVAHIDATAREFMGAMFGPRQAPPVADETARLTEQEWEQVIDTLPHACAEPIPATGPLLYVVQAILTARLSEQKAEHAAAILALADEWHCDDPGCDREGGDLIRALVGADGAKALAERDARVLREAADAWAAEGGPMPAAPWLRDRADRLDGA